ncbi:uncharacterized protein TNCV_1352461 [Trichonephila clavipes]|nr:uncharacterized protein TNCV_1352461 [Trichonephila clavipes]
MFSRNRCTDVPTKPSGHTQFSCTSGFTPPCNANISSGAGHCQQGLPSDFSGPYKAFNPPGWREPAAGEHERGDVPYLPSYLDPFKPASRFASGKQDNLYMRGPFFRGVSETHEQFVNRDGISPRKFYEFVRHYEEPGMKYDKSITQTDFVPPQPMLPRDVSPCLQEPPSEPQYVSNRPVSRNPHAKELEIKFKEPELVYIDKKPEHKYTTEAGDNYICYQRQKPTETPIKDYVPPESELFLEHSRSTHTCPHRFPQEFLCDGNKYEVKTDWSKTQNKGPGKTPWLLFPRNYKYPNGYMILPNNAQHCQGESQQCQYGSQPYHCQSQQCHGMIHQNQCNDQSNHYKFYPVGDQCQHY